MGVRRHHHRARASTTRERLRSQVTGEIDDIRVARRADNNIEKRKSKENARLVPVREK